MTVAPETTQARVITAHGGGGTLTHTLIRERLMPRLSNPLLDPLGDAAILPRIDDRIAFTTDSYVITPIEFPGGDIGRLSVAGTVNDLAVIGAEPIAISLGLILEEGLPLDVLDRIIASIARTAGEAGVQVATGDTKVIDRRSDTDAGMFINTTGIGRLRPDIRLGIERIEPGDCVLVNGPIAEHGLAVMSVRNGLEFDTPLRSDAAPLAGLIQHFLAASGADHPRAGADPAIRFLRDATRGGVGGVLADICEGSGLSVEIDERRVPMTPAARQAAEMLGLDPLGVANEGKVVCVVAAADGQRVLERMRSHSLGRHAACIGVVTERQPPLVELVTRIGGRRIVRRPYGEDLPRIC